ncbi:hypothetical protein DFR42_12520 [Undibacterium pigrum]|uniref:Uncharacterized protein n=1 Tax=Undibacterium pigrum TaxID=401470 RepID=A0A318IN59_9BURK|nr:hypothetical protein DFR42_12520 [Undibacterium pigrum]
MAFTCGALQDTSRYDYNYPFAEREGKRCVFPLFLLFGEWFVFTCRIQNMKLKAQSPTSLPT